MKCKFCGAEVKLGERCQYCGSIAEAFYYKPEEPPEVVGRNQTDRKEYTVQKGDSLLEDCTEVLRKRCRLLCAGTQKRH
jgi:hypothetical protein